MEPQDFAQLAPAPGLATSIELVRKAQGGDRGALDQLFERYYERVYRIVRIRMGARLRGVLESLDLVQETCAVAARKLDAFQPEDRASLIQWLARIAEHQIHDAADRIAAQKRDVGRETPLESGDLGSTRGASPSSIVANQELKEIYDACVEGLPGDYRELILLRDYALASWEETARAVSAPNVHAAQEKYRRAQVRLAGSLRKRLGT